MSGILEWIVELIRRIFGDTTRAVVLGESVCCPLFWRDANGKIRSTWDYLAMSAAEQQRVRSWVKDRTHADETPAIAFLLTPNGPGGNLFLRFPDELNDAAVEAAEAALQDLARDGIAAIATLYTDDATPRWWDIGPHIAGWRQLDKRIGKLFSAAALSIESNEGVRSMEQLTRCLDAVREAFPGVKEVGTHLQWNGGSEFSAYRWTSYQTTPLNLEFVLVENSWHPAEGDRRGVAGLKQECEIIMTRIPRGRLIWHEYNLAPDGKTLDAQRVYLRGTGTRGLG
ncbi:MAG: hypothetical protein PHX05_00080 [Acidobacteriota bacterium]|nr:hypothetical protein [Acidobacteriota bacterium]